MNRVLIGVLVAVGVLVVGGVAALSMWTIPAPTKQVEKVVPNDRFAR